MLIDYVMNLVLSLSEWTVSLLPDVTLPINLAAYISPVANFIGYVDTFVDIEVMAACVAMILLVDNWALVVKLAVKIWSLLPFT